MNPGKKPQDRTNNQAGQPSSNRHDADDALDMNDLQEDGSSRSQISGPLSDAPVVSWAELLKTKSGDGSGFSMDVPGTLASDQGLLAQEPIEDDKVSKHDFITSTSEPNIEIPFFPGDESTIDLNSVPDLHVPSLSANDLLTETPQRDENDGDGEWSELSGRVNLMGSQESVSGSQITLVESGARPRPKAADTTKTAVRRAPNKSLSNAFKGIAAGIFICAALWMLGIRPGAMARSVKHEAPPEVATQPVPTLDFGLNLLEAGEFDAAITALDRTEKTPRSREAAGQARWLRYLKHCRLTGTAINLDGDDARLAQEALREADTPVAVLWLGLIEETAGRIDTAKTIYGEAQGRFPDQSKLFKAAIDRLESKPGSPANKAAFHPALGLAIFTLLVETAPETPDEAGFKFWEALKLAKNRDYAAANAALQQAREAHDSRRVLLARKGLNANSDPLEEIFLRSSDELQGYWTLREDLQSSGLDLSANNDKPSAQIKLIVAKAKEATEKANKLESDFAAIEEKAKASQLAAEKADEKLRTVAAEAKDAFTKLSLANSAKDSAEAELKKTREQLDIAKRTPTVDPAEITKLKADRQQLEKKVKSLDVKLTEAAESHDAIQRSHRELSGLVKQVRQKLQTPADASAEELLAAIDRAKAVKPRTELAPIAVGVYAADSRGDAEFAKGLSHYRNGDMASAEQELNAAIRFNDRDARYWMFLGLTHLANGNADQANKDLQRAVELERRNLPNPGSVDQLMERMPLETRAIIRQARNR